MIYCDGVGQCYHLVVLKSFGHSWKRFRLLFCFENQVKIKSLAALDEGLGEFINSHAL